MPAEFVQRGRILVQQAQHQEAVRVCRLGLLANPGEIEGRLVLGSALMALGRYDEVLAEMRQALEMDARSASAMAMKGEALWRKGDPVQARQVLGQAGDIAPLDPYVARLREAVEGDLPPLSERTGTIDIDPDIEGVEIRGSGVHDRASVAQDPDSAMEIHSIDLEPVSVEKPLPGLARPAVDAAALVPPADEPTIEDGGVGRDRASKSGVIGGGPHIDSLFPEDEGGVSGLHTLGPELAVPPARPQPQPQPQPQPRPAVDALARTAMAPPRERGPATSDDMRTIRAGLGVAKPAAAGKKRGKKKAGRAAPTRGRGLPLWLYLILACAVVAGGVLAGFELRKMRLAGQIDSVRADAQALAADGSYRGALAARELYARIRDASDTAAARADLALAEARLAAEYGARRSEAARAVAGLGKGGGPVAAAARGYLALSQGEVEALRSAADEVLEAGDDPALGHYLRARAALLSGEADAAATAAEAALAARPSPAAQLALARAEAARGQVSAALAALAGVDALAAGHPLAAAWRARMQVRAGALPGGSEPEDGLKALLAAGDDSVAPAHAAWAGLALAEVELARGDREAAASAAEGALARWPGGDPAFAAALVDLQLSLGDVAAARGVAERAATSFGGRGRILLAHVALAAGDPAAAEAALAAAGDAVATSPRARLVRGRVALHRGELERAAADLDAALAANPSSRDALVARARVDIASGQARAALGRLEPLAAGDDPEAAVVYASALRRTGDAKKARRVLAPLLEGKRARVDALLELAELELAAGDRRGARRAYARAIEREPKSVDARLGAARLAIDTGETERARKLADELAAEAPENRRVLVEAARIRTLSGDAEAAIALLDAAGAAEGALAGAVARERGRALLRRQKLSEAKAAFARAIELDAADPESRILLMETLVASRDAKAAQKALQDITKVFRDQPVRTVAAGLHALVSERADEAAAAFIKAGEELEKAGAGPRELARVAYWLGRSHELAGKLEDAVTELQAAVALDPTHADAYYWLGQIDFMLQKPADMVRHYEKSLAIDPGANPLAHFFLGQHYASAGKTEAARKALETFLERWPEKSGDLVSEAKTLLGSLAQK